MRLRSVFAALTLLATAAGPAHADVGDRVLGVLTGWVHRLERAAGLAENGAFEAAPTVTRSGGAWLVTIPAWHVAFGGGSAGCAADAWTVTLLPDRSVEAASDFDTSCHVALGAEIFTFGIADRRSTLLIPVSGGQHWSVDGDLSGHGGSVEPATTTLRTGRLSAVLDVVPGPDGQERNTLHGTIEFPRWTDATHAVAIGARQWAYEIEVVDDRRAMSSMLGSSLCTFLSPQAPQPFGLAERGCYKRMLAGLLEAYGPVRLSGHATDPWVRVGDNTLTAAMFEADFGLGDPRDFSAELAVDALRMTPEVSELTPWLPQSGRIVFHVDALPVIPWWMMSIDQARAGAVPLDDAVVLAMSGAMLDRAGTRLAIDRLSLRSDVLTLEGEGAIASADSPAGLVARADLAVGALDRLIAAVRALPGGDDLAAGMAFLSVLGKPVPAIDGEAAQRFEFSLDQDGGMLLNGADLGAVLR